MRGEDELDDGLARLLPPVLRGTRRGRRAAGRRDRRRQRICIVADYDCDGATACAVALRGLRLLGADRHVSYLVPDRVVDGYGLTPPIVDLASAAAAPTC